MSEPAWFRGAVYPTGGSIKILDVKPCEASGYVEAWMEVGKVKRRAVAPCVIVIDGANARLWLSSK